VLDTEKAIIKSSGEITMAKAEQQLILSEVDIKTKRGGETALVAHAGFKPCYKCWNCEERGHLKHECPKPPKKKWEKREKGEKSGEYASPKANVPYAPSHYHGRPQTREVVEMGF
jgi:hypothetical protein